MRLREFIEKEKEDPDEIRSELIRAIELANDTDDMKKVITLITSAFKKLNNDDFIFVQQHFDRKMRSIGL